MRKRLARSAIALLAAAWCAGATGQAYPTKGIRWIVPYPPGGSTDIIVRTVGQKVAEAWGIQVTKLNAQIDRVMKLADVQARFAEIGTSYIGGTPEQAGAFFRSEMEKWSKVAKAAGLKPE